MSVDDKFKHGRYSVMNCGIKCTIVQFCNGCCFCWNVPSVCSFGSYIKFFYTVKHLTYNYIDSQVHVCKACINVSKELGVGLNAQTYYVQYKSGNVKMIQLVIFCCDIEITIQKPALHSCICIWF